MESEAAVIPRLLTVRELVAATGIPRWRIHEMCAQKKLPFLRVGKCYRFSSDAIAMWIESNTNKEQ